LAILDIGPEGFEVRAIVEGLSMETLKQKTGAPIKASSKLSVIRRNSEGKPFYDR
jgi:acyl CoA:acetate/3-ketoacid CoA transferase beta subunit